MINSPNRVHLSNVVSIPQLGEGLTEVRIVALLKRPGDLVNMDEPIFAVETDKANVEIESPYAGIVGDWLVDEGQFVPIHAPVVHIAPPAAQSKTLETPHETIRIPPRTRALCRSLGLDDEVLQAIPARTNTLQESDVHDYLKSRSDLSCSEISCADMPCREKPRYQDSLLSDRQRAFIRRAAPSPLLSQVPVPATVKRPMPWAYVDRAFKATRSRHPELKITHFQLMAYHVAQTAAAHPKFRSVLIGQECIREFDHINLGIAVALPGDELATALLPQADTLDFAAFVGQLKARTREARRGQDQADAAMQIVLTYLGNSGITDATPTLVAPAVAVLFIGDKYEESGRTLVNLVLTFDHRLINGLGAAKFLQALVHQFEKAATE